MTALHAIPTRSTKLLVPTHAPARFALGGTGRREEHDVLLVESIFAEDEGYEAAENRLLVASLLERLAPREQRL